MESETDTDTISLCDSEISRENYKSPESSDCEGYATPLASSLTDLTTVNHGITIDVPEDTDMDSQLDSGERTPVSTPRAQSPPIVKQTMYLQKPRILVMTQREIHDESSEEEFFDADVQIRDVAQQLLDGVEDAEEEDVTERADTPIMELDAEVATETEEMVSEEEERATPVQIEPVKELVMVETSELVAEAEIVDEETMSLVHEIIETMTAEVENSPEVLNLEKSEEATIECENMEAQSPEQLEITELLNEPKPDNEESNEEQSPETNVEIIEVEVAPTTDFQKISDEENIENTFDNCSNNILSFQNTQTAEENLEKSCENLVELPADQEPKSEKNEEDVMLNVDSEPVPTVDISISLPEEKNTSAEIKSASENEQTPDESSDFEENADLTSEISQHSKINEQNSEECQIQVFNETETANTNSSETLQTQETDRPVLFQQTPEHEEMPEVFSEIIIATTPVFEEINTIPAITTLSDEHVSNQETIENELMTTVVNSDEVKTSFHNMFSDKVKVDFDGYSSGKEESLSSSTSSESFEFAEPVSSNHVQDEKTQALRNSIIERYPSNDTDDDLDSVGDDFDEDLLAVKQISAEVEQLVAAINAFGRDEEQQMSAYLVGKKMAAEKKRKSAMDTGVVTSACHDQTVQTDNDLHLPVAMESLQVEIDKLQADLEKVKCGEKELLKINSQLKVELEESQKTIDGIEVEAEQQYTELTSEIDELCEIVQRKDQELAAIKEKVANLSVSEINLKDDVDSQRIIVQRQKEIIESLREELDAITKKLGDVTKARDKAIEEATIYKMKNMERDRFLQREAQMSMEIEDLQRELNKQRLILNQTSMAKLADTFDRKVLQLENELRERDMLICKQNQIINSHRKSPTGSVITHRKMQPRASVLAAAGNLPSAGSSSESFQNGLDADAKEALLSFILSDRHNQLANIYNIGRILDLTPQEERSVERHLTKDRFA